MFVSVTLKQLLSTTRIHYLLLFALVVLNILVAYFYVQSPFQPYKDTSTYIEAMNFLKGGPLGGEIVQFRLLTVPAMLWLSVFVGYFVGDLAKSMLIINIGLCFLLIPVFYQLVFLIYRDKRAAFLCTALLFSSFSMWMWGTAMLTDMGGWFFFILATLFAVRYFYYNEQKKYYFLAIAASVAGVFFKEYGALGIISLIFLIALSDFDYKRKLKEIIGAGILFVVFPFLYHIWVYLHFNFSYFDWFMYNANKYAAPQAVSPNHSFALLIKVVGWVYFAGWPIFLWGLWQEKKYFDITRLKVLAALLPTSLMFLIWPSFAQRAAFVLVPWLVLSSGFGLSKIAEQFIGSVKIKSNYLIGLILLAFILFNYTYEYWLRVINLPF